MPVAGPRGPVARHRALYSRRLKSPKYRVCREIASFFRQRGVTISVPPRKSFVGKILIGQKQLHTSFYVKRGRWVYEGSGLELKKKKRRGTLIVLVDCRVSSSSLF